MEKKKRAFLFVILFVWAAFLFFFALQPKGLVLLLLKKAAAFKTAHLIAYAVLAFLSASWFHTLWPYWKRSTPLSLIVSLSGGFAAAFLCGASTEYVQIFSVDRIPDIKDFKLDLIGASYGLGLFFILWLGRLILEPARRGHGRALQLDLFSES